MKKLYCFRSGTIYTTLILLTCVIMSCSDMDDSFQRFYKDGEVIYAAKPDSISSRPGKDRILLQMFVKSYRISLIRVYWNSHADSLDIPVTGPGVYEKMVENMEERGHVFQVITFDEFGNKSIPVEVISRAYGDMFQQILSNRVIRSTSTFENNTLTINWSGPVDNAIRSDVVYTNTSGVETVLQVPMSETKTVISDLLSGLRYRTLFLPDTTAIDIFYTDFKDIPMIVEQKVAKTGWTITGFDSEEATGEGPPNGMAISAIDDNLGTFWHSRWSGSDPKPVYPHWFSIDMGTSVTITAIEVFRRQGVSSGQTRHQFFYSNNGTDWTLFGVFAMNPNIDQGQKFRAEEMPTARYIKYVALEGPSIYAYLAEINVYKPQ